MFFKEFLTRKKCRNKLPLISNKWYAFYKHLYPIQLSTDFIHNIGFDLALNVKCDIKLLVKSCSFLWLLDLEEKMENLIK